MATKDKPIHPNIKAKKPPQNVEAEQAALGSVMLDQAAALHSIPTLTEEDFYLTAHKYIFAAMSEAFNKNIPVDIVTVTQELNRQGRLEDAGGVDYLASLTSALASAANYKFHTDIVKENGLRRKLIGVSELIIEEAYAGENENVLQFAESKIFALGDETSRKELNALSEAVKTAYDRMEEIGRDKAAYRGVPSGFSLLDGYLNGFQNGDLIVLAARPGHGKTSLGMNFVVNAATTPVE
ncbi:MAG: replicative DNA helicase, partial [Firmicutes bacterium]|nr:replicative DNA helicase [Bacillota bacterium]